MARGRLFLSPPHMSGRELRYIEEAFGTNYVAPAGPMLARFEEAFAEYSGLPYVVALTSGTAAIHLALKNLNLARGDEIWTANLTFVASIAPAVQEGLRPVFLDVSPETWTLDSILLAETLDQAARKGSLPKAVIPTDLYGQSCDLDAILAACGKHGVPVICDSAEAVGARYKDRHAGDGAFATAYSFNGNKIITTSGGGILASRDRSVVDRARYLATQARQPVAHYEHTETGFNYRLSNILAAIGCGQLDVLDERVARRRAIFESYEQSLADIPGISFMPEATYGRSTRWLTVILIDRFRFGADRETIRLALEKDNIEARPVWKPLHLQPVFSEARRIGGKVAERLFADGLCLPSGTAMTDSDVDRVVSVLRATGNTN